MADADRTCVFPAYRKWRFWSSLRSTSRKTTSLVLLERAYRAFSGERNVQPKLLSTAKAGNFELYSS